MIADSVAFLVAEGKRVLFDAEHFFDGFALDPGYALACLRAAGEAGAERLVLCDTNGGSLPPQVRTAFAVVTEALDVIASGKPKMLEFGVADETAWNVGLSCGGTIRVFVEKVS